MRDQLTDPKFYDRMSKLLDDLIKESRADTAAYEEFLRKAEELVKKMSRREAGTYPRILDGRTEAIALFNNLDSIPVSTFVCPADPEDRAKLALAIDDTIRQHAPAGWKGDKTRETQVLNAIYPMMSKDRDATQGIFEIIKNQPGYG